MRRRTFAQSIGITILGGLFKFEWPGRFLGLEELIAPPNKPPSEGTTYVWHASSSCEWKDPKNWTPVGIPGDGDSVVFMNQAAKQATLDESITLQNVYMVNGAASIGEAAKVGKVWLYKGTYEQSTRDTKAEPDSIDPNSIAEGWLVR